MQQKWWTNFTGIEGRLIKLVRERTQNTNLKLNNTKQKIKRAISKGAGEKSLHKPELVGQSRNNKSKLQQRKPKGCKLEGSRREEHGTNPVFVRQNTQNKFLTKAYTGHLRWLDWILWGWCLPSLSINYVGMSKDTGKRLPQLYYIKMNISYDLDFIAVGVAMAT